MASQLQANCQVTWIRPFSSFASFLNADGVRSTSPALQPGQRSLTVACTIFPSSVALPSQWGGIEKFKTNIITVNINLAAAVLAILVLRRIQCYSVLGILDRVSTGTRVTIGCVERPYSCNDMS